MTADQWLTFWTKIFGMSIFKYRYTDTHLCRMIIGTIYPGVSDDYIASHPPVNDNQRR